MLRAPNHGKGFNGAFAACLLPLQVSTAAMRAADAWEVSPSAAIAGLTLLNEKLVLIARAPKRSIDAVNSRLWFVLCAHNLVPHTRSRMQALADSPRP